MISFAILPAFSVLAVLVAAPTAPEEGCPSARQVTEAMQARFPGALAPAGSPRPDVLRSLLDVAPDGTVVRFALVDARGDTQLRRTLPAPGRARAVADCLALADTVAAIVDRYLGTIAYEVPESALPPPLTPPPVPAAADAAVATAVQDQAAPASPQRRGGLAAVGLGWRATEGGRGSHDGVEFRLAGQLDLSRSSSRVALAASIGLSPGIDATLDARVVTLRRFPFRVGVVVPLPAGPGFVEPVLQVGGDLFVASSTRGEVAGAARTIGFSPVAEAAVGYRLKLAGPVFLRPVIAFGVAMKRYDVEVQNQAAPPALSTPWGYASFGIDTAVVFR